MTAQSVYINQDTKDIETNSLGQIVNKNANLTEMYARLSIPVTSYRYDKTLGSTIPSFIQNRQVITINKIKKSIDDGLLPMVNQQRIVNITYNSIRTGIGSFLVNLSATDSQSNNFTFPYSVQG